ncbi:hypothetical protein AURDEDRAFT_175981 [Auricularia subglabra TFB-10046 SS5]|nr:hypothetical protein AURDEDRAFT_175981 [Auricularia subglabra TFB-10046 SS5]
MSDPRPLLEQLLPNVRKDLASAVPAACASDDQHTNELADQPCQDVAELFQTAVADFLRSRQPSRATILPAEIWCKIWSLLAQHRSLGSRTSAPTGALRPWAAHRYGRA